jgi:hypothetical protein
MCCSGFEKALDLFTQPAPFSTSPKNVQSCGFRDLKNGFDNQLTSSIYK